MRLIDADELMNELSRQYLFGVPKHNARILDARCVIADMPTIDAVPIVRCKDCKYHTDDNEEPDAVYCENTTGGVGGLVSNNFFCAGGKRKEEKEWDNFLADLTEEI